MAPTGIELGEWVWHMEHLAAGDPERRGCTVCDWYEGLSVQTRNFGRKPLDYNELMATLERLNEKGAIATEEAPPKAVAPKPRPRPDFRTHTAAWEAMQACRQFYPWRCKPLKIKAI